MHPNTPLPLAQSFQKDRVKWDEPVLGDCANAHFCSQSSPTSTHESISRVQTNSGIPEIPVVFVFLYRTIWPARLRLPHLPTLPGCGAAPPFADQHDPHTKSEVYTYKLVGSPYFKNVVPLAKIARTETNDGPCSSGPCLRPLLKTCGMISRRCKVHKFMGV